MPTSQLQGAAGVAQAAEQNYNGPRFLFADQALHIGEVEEATCFELRKIGLQPATARAVPGYAYAREQFHLAAFVGSEIVSAATFLLEDQSDDEIYRAEGHSWRLRGMATLPRHRNSGYATAILDHGIRLLRQRQASLLWANGRSTAIEFYLRHGFVQTSEERTRPGVQPHYRIERQL
ncbi:GNAT family N-acetyltransferase [Sinorhizobium meliloti]|nr:GNAT family N-acetyltransferase [Sinorhizobium meliloti]